MEKHANQDNQADHQSQSASKQNSNARFKNTESTNSSAPHQLQKIANEYVENRFPVQKKEKTNNTGLPDQLKSGIENLSGHSMDDVKVHYNSNKPAQLQAHAYAQGNQIHIAPGQEKHLAHEAWHVVQQKQGRVKPTRQLKAKVNINDDEKLEKEADVMGSKAVNYAQSNGRKQLNNKRPVQRIVQRVPLKVSITNGITHVVKKMNNSLFGEGRDFRDGEIDEQGELSFGQIITIDTDKTFRSRRGPNQEVPSNRQKDKESKPNVIWYHVLSLRGEDVSAQKLYVRDGTFKKAGNLEEIDELSSSDEQLLQRIFDVSMKRGRHVKGPWTDFMGIAIDKGLMSKSEALKSSAMIDLMYSFSILGKLLSRNYSNFGFAIRLDLPPAQGMKLMLPFIGQLIRKQTGIAINGLETGGNYLDWTKLSDLSNYLDTSYGTFTSAFESFSNQQRLSLLKTLRSPDTNIEKFITLMQSATMEMLMSGSGPQGELEGEFSGHPTSSGGIGRGLIQVAYNFLSKKFLFSKYSESTVYNLEYDETISNFLKWMETNGFTFDVIRDAIRNSARGSDTEEPITSEEIRKKLMESASYDFE